MWQLSLFRRIFCAHKLFGTEVCREEDGRLCSDIYRTSGRTDWPDGRSSLPCAADDFLFFTTLSPRCQLGFRTISYLLAFVLSVLSSVQLYLVVQHWEGHGFNCTLHRVYNPIFTFFREERVYSWHLSADIYRWVQCSGEGQVKAFLESICKRFADFFPIHLLYLFNFFSLHQKVQPICSIVRYVILLSFCRQ